MKNRLPIITFIGAVGLVASAWFLTSPGGGENISETGIETDRDIASQVKLTPNYGAIPLHFESNAGQVNAQVKFLSRGSGYSLFLTSDEAVLTLRKSSVEGEDPKTDFLRMRIVGANSSPKIEGENLLDGETNYIVGNDSSKWKTGIANFERVRYSNIYDGVDVVYYGNAKQLEYDFVVAPNISVDRINLSFDGAKSVELDENGDLLLKFDDGELRQRKPAVSEIQNLKFQISNLKSDYRF